MVLTARLVCALPLYHTGVRRVRPHERVIGLVRSGRVEQRSEGIETGRLPAGIVIRPTAETASKPKISAFIWGGKVRPEPTLPFGRWKPTAA